MVSVIRISSWLACAGLTFLGTSQSAGDVLRFDSAEKWRTWHMPQGIMLIDENGHLGLKRFRKDISAVEDAREFTHPTQQRGEVTGGIWWAGSNAGEAERVIDGKLDTHWQPDSEDTLPKWILEIDLGRPVLAREIRLTFPDIEGARPFRQFSVYVATGARTESGDDVFKYELVHSTSLPNQAREISVGLGDPKDTTFAVDPGIELGAERPVRLIQFVRFKADEKSAEAALAEVEVMAVGDNIGLGTLARGGLFTHGEVARQPENLFDGLMDTHAPINNAQSIGEGEDIGLWWAVDLGAVFWLDGAYLYWKDRGEALTSFRDPLNAGGGKSQSQLWVSASGAALAGGVDFELLVQRPEFVTSREQALRHFRYLFSPRRVRHLRWVGRALNSADWQGHLMEFMLFSPGYPAQVELRSELIDLGGIAGDNRAKSIKGISWDADLPPETRMQLRSRSGNSLENVYTFYDKKGAIVTEEKWLSSPKVIRGPVDTSIVVGSDWGAWSNFYQLAGESFKSENPRRFMQLEMILSSDNPHAAPTVRSLAIEFEDALLQGAAGRVLPRRIAPNVDTRFTYAMWPVADAQDSGFDVVRIAVPGIADTRDLSVRLGSQPIQPKAVAVEADSLLSIVLPATVTLDSIAVEFGARVLRNAAVFTVDLGNSERPGVWQSVEAVERQAQTVFLPELANSDQLIGDLEISPPIFTPNGDGINDVVEIRFVVFKMDTAQPQVAVHDLAGALVAELDPVVERGLQVFTWSGRSAAGERVPPGMYLCRIDVGAQSGENVLVRTLAVAY